MAMVTNGYESIITIPKVLSMAGFPQGHSTE